VNWSVDDNLDDNRDDNYSLNYGNYSPKSLLSCLVTAPARSWQCGVRLSSPLRSRLVGRVRLTSVPPAWAFCFSANVHCCTPTRRNSHTTAHACGCCRLLPTGLAEAQLGV
jgi:hypothetical protein